jgi:hypothetical protein
MELRASYILDKCSTIEAHTIHIQYFLVAVFSSLEAVFPPATVNIILDIRQPTILSMVII